MVAAKINLKIQEQMRLKIGKTKNSQPQLKIYWFWKKNSVLRLVHFWTILKPIVT